LNLQPAPEFAAWLSRMALLDDYGRLAPPSVLNSLVRGLLT
jgi:hypothetical protein